MEIFEIIILNFFIFYLIAGLYFVTVSNEKENNLLKAWVVFLFWPFYEKPISKIMIRFFSKEKKSQHGASERL